MRKLLLEILLGLSLPAAIFHTQLGGIFTAEQPISKKGANKMHQEKVC